ncbi:MAG TPA: conjugative transposon protein TraM, partial [Chitinophagaceae bacterium]|nr:conjugative transposon protein TraM [Chitinophagaceae bacterium]
NKDISHSLKDANAQRDREILRSLNRMNQPNSTGVQEGSTRENFDENEDMANFKKRMLFMDSLRKSLINGEQTSSGKNIKQKKFDPSGDTTFRPLHVATSLNRNTGYFNTVTNVHEDVQSISAMIDQNVKVHLGSRVRIRLLKDIFVGNHKIEKGSYLYGMVSGFQTQRVNISITQIQYQNTSLPVKLDVYDNDGYLGLYVPGSNFREFTKEIGTQATRGMSQVISPDGSDVQTNLLSQVFNTTTTTMAKLIKKDKAFLKYNYIVYLKERKSDHAN